jgi:hypothetical protein
MTEAIMTAEMAIAELRRHMKLGNTADRTSSRIRDTSESVAQPAIPPRRRHRRRRPMKLDISVVLLTVGQRNSAEQAKHAREQNPTHDTILDALWKGKLRNWHSAIGFQPNPRIGRKPTADGRKPFQIRIGMMM